MVRLSPKSLRFAKEARESDLRRRDEYFRNFSDSFLVEYQQLDKAAISPSRYIEVSEQMAKIFLAVIEDDLSSDRLEAEDPGDIMFSEKIVRSLADALRSMV